ncbi:MAG: tol-pal system-associated acyl-CoA thioesterase [Xanthomonadales bacterium]|nr:tol-pal system-associated acyl-CoA thioesterase [Xanthomonadales bacterium]
MTDSAHPQPAAPSAGPSDAGRPGAFRWPVRVYFEDTDTGGVVYHAGYLRFFERCRTEWLRSRGLDQQTLLAQHAIAFAVRSMAVDWLAPARLDDLLEVGFEVREARRASMKGVQRIVRAADGVLLCSASVRVACVRVPDFRPVAIPDTLLETLSA